MSNRKVKILLIGPNFYYFLHSIKNVFQQMGYNVLVCQYDNPIHPYGVINKIHYKLSQDKEALKELSRINYQSQIESVFKQFKPQITFIVNGDNLLSSTVKLFSESSNVGIWLFDSVQRFPECMANLLFAHKVFCYEKNDITFIKQSCGVDAFFIPQAVDESLYYKMNTKKVWDIVFAGDIFHSEKRKKIVPSVVNKYNQCSICIWGEYKPIYKDFVKWLLREKRDVYRNRNTNVEQLNIDYNKARIVLNVHHEQQRNGANPKVFEIAMSGAYQICDANPYLEEVFQNGEVGLFHNETELYELIDYALTHDMSEKSEKAYQIVLENHTLSSRLKHVLNILNQ